MNDDELIREVLMDKLATPREKIRAMRVLQLQWSHDALDDLMALQHKLIDPVWLEVTH